MNMTALQIVFLLVGAVTLAAAFMVVTNRKLVHAALYLILALAGIAVLFVILGAGFLAVVQVAVYIDAIAILIIVTLMLTRRAMSDDAQQTNRNWPIAALTALIFLGAMLFMISQMPAFATQSAVLVGTPEEYLEELGRSLVDIDRYVIPFEVASVMLLAALIGSIMVARPPFESSGKGGEE
jgi:NADH-quinone oxidoreductase subunit J